MASNYVCLRHGLLNIISPLLRLNCSEKKIPFKKLLLTGITPGHPRALMVMYNEAVVFMPANSVHSAAHESSSNLNFQVL